MSIIRCILALALAVGLSACAKRAEPPAFDAASRADSSGGEVVAAQPRLPPVTVRDIIVEVPRELTVNERNTFLPKGDIVWRGDPIGNRREQVKQIVYDALREGTAEMSGAQVIDLKVQVRKFHALSHKARYTTGGTHDIQFWLAPMDPETGEYLVEPWFVDSEFDALGGKAAVAAEAQGITQKVRIHQHLSYVIQLELTDPEGFESDSEIWRSVFGNI